MTAEIAILNRQAVAVAADSAMTVGGSGKKVWKLGNKLFSLGPKNDIAIMIYGAGDFLSVPWETIIKTYRDIIHNKKFETVEECAANFQDYVRKIEINKDIISELHRKIIFSGMIESLKDSFEYSKKLEFRKKCIKESSEYIDEMIGNYDKLENTPERKDFLKKYTAEIIDLSKEIFNEYITREISKNISDLCYEAFCRNVETPNSTGIVITGFGKSQIFPALSAFVIDGRFDGFLRAWRQKYINLNDKKSPISSITSFAQTDMSQIFMEGISEKNMGFIMSFLERILDKKSRFIVDSYVNNNNERKVEMQLQRNDNSKIMEIFHDEFREYIRETMVKPVIRVVSSLPKEEMAAMAEALVEITTLRRKVGSPIESVGGPTDVAVISKGDGVVWVKRKHYFDPALNADFFRRKEIRDD